ncbi:hypothetical protein WJX77_008304 [Trebouxia sp. C0004]
MSLQVAHLTSLTCRWGRANKSAPVVTAVCLSPLRQPASKPVAAASISLQCDRASGPAPTRSVACRSAEQVLELSEDSVEEALQDAKQELMQLFDESVGITGTVTLAELDGPFVKLRLQGRFWHKRADVLARVAAYLQRRIPDLMEVEIEDDAQLDDSAAQF